MIEASRLKNPGPMVTKGLSSPGRTTPCGTAAKQLVLNHERPALCTEAAYWCGAFWLGLQTRSGRMLAGPPLPMPRPAGAAPGGVVRCGWPGEGDRMAGERPPARPGGGVA